MENIPPTNIVIYGFWWRNCLRSRWLSSRADHSGSTERNYRDIEYFKLYAQSVGFVVDHDAINPVHNKNMQIDSKLFDLVAFHEDLMLSTNNIINILKI